MPLFAYILYLPYLFLVNYHLGMPNMQYRAQRFGTQRSLCASYEESRRKRFGIIAKWLCVWKTQIRGV